MQRVAVKLAARVAQRAVVPPRAAARARAASSTPGLIRKAFVMSVNEGCEDEYEKRHRPIWEDLAAVLKDHGVHNYSSASRRQAPRHTARGHRRDRSVLHQLVL